MPPLIESNKSRRSGTQGTIVKFLLVLSLIYIGWLHWHLHRLTEAVEINRAAIAWVFQYLADLEVVTQRMFGVE